MRRLNVSILVVLSAYALAGAAQAADMPLRGSLDAFEVREFLSPWYVRGDVGYWFSTKSSGSTPSISDVGAVDFGIGYRGTGWRADVTSSYAFQPHANISPFGTPDMRARINVIATLFNGYVDLGTWYGVTPYVGAGLGFSYMRPIQFASVSLPPSLASNSGTFDLSWDVTAGFSFPITRNFLIDSSYRYLHVGSPKTDFPGVGTLDWGAMNFHEIRTGFRYLID
jgi:opacity protein-like surface antigen